MAADRLGRAVHDDVRAERERPLADRRGEGVVHRQQGPVVVRKPGRALEVHHREGGIGRGFDVQDAVARLERACPGVRVARIDAIHAPAEARGAPVEQRVGSAVALVECHDVVARLETGEEHRRDRRHAGGEQQPHLGALEGREPLLARAQRRMPIALVERARRAGGLGGAHRVEVREGERGRVNDRRAHRAVRGGRGAPRAGGRHRTMNRAGARPASPRGRTVGSSHDCLRAGGIVCRMVKRQGFIIP